MTNVAEMNEKAKQKL